MNRPKLPHYVMWRVDGEQKTRAFETRERQIDFAKSLAGDVKKHGLDAYRLNEGEARNWRAFRLQIGDAPLDAVAACWAKHGAIAVRPTLTMLAATAQYVAAKEGEGVDAATVSHYGPVFDRLNASFGNRGIGTLTRDEVAAWLKEQQCEASTLRTRFCRVRAFFNWLVETQLIDCSPCLGMKPPRVTAKEVKILTLQQTRDLFVKNLNEVGDRDARYRELLGRLALEAFVGLRNATAAQVVAEEIHDDGLRIPAKKLKTRLPQFLDNLPENSMAWLRWSQPKTWKMTPRQYLEAKSNAFIRAGIPPVHNCLRHGFASYHVAAYRDPSRTSVIMCHTSPKQLWGTYKGIANQPDGIAVFKIRPPSS